MSTVQVTQMKKRCVDVISSSATYDRDLRQLCLLIARRQAKPRKMQIGPPRKVAASFLVLAPL